MESYRTEFDELRRTILDAGSERFVYIQFPGNAGDALIADGTYQFLDAIGISYESDFTNAPSVKDRDYSNTTVLLGGGGNLVPIYEHAGRFLDAHLSSIKRLIVLPHTIRERDALLRRMGDNCTVFCREQTSYDYCASVTTGAQIALCHDMAFFWNPNTNATRAGGRLRRALTSRELAKYTVKSAVRRLQNRRLTSTSVLNAFRIDAERTDREVPPDNIDLSTVLLARRNSRDVSAAVVRAMAGFMTGAGKVRTDRLHISILGAFLGLDVEMHDNSYGKNRSVYEHSIRNRYGNVTFVEHSRVGRQQLRMS